MYYSSRVYTYIPVPTYHTHPSNLLLPSPIKAQGKAVTQGLAKRALKKWIPLKLPRSTGVPCRGISPQLEVTPARFQLRFFFLTLLYFLAFLLGHWLVDGEARIISHYLIREREIPNRSPTRYS